MKKVEWIKLYTDLFENEKIKQIADFPDGDALIVIWIRMLILAGKRNDGGYIYLTPSVPYTDKMLASSLQKPLPVVQLALETFKAFGMIDIKDDGYIVVTNWDRYQNIDGLEEIREQGKERSARYRARQKSGSAPDAVPEDPIPDSEETNVEEPALDRKEVTAKGKKPQEGSRASYEAIIDEFTKDANLKECIFEFIKMRKLNKKPMTNRALKIMLNRLVNLSTDTETQFKILDQSIFRCWDSVYELRSDYQPSRRIGANGVKLTGETKSDLDGII